MIDISKLANDAADKLIRNQQLQKQLEAQLNIPVDARLNLEYLQILAQNIAIDKGFLTTQVYIEAKDTNAGHLELTVVPGRITSI